VADREAGRPALAALFASALSDPEGAVRAAAARQHMDRDNPAGSGAEKLWKIVEEQKDPAARAALARDYVEWIEGTIRRLDARAPESAKLLRDVFAKAVQAADEGASRAKLEKARTDRLTDCARQMEVGHPDAIPLLVEMAESKEERLATAAFNRLLERETVAAGSHAVVDDLYRKAKTPERRKQIVSKLAHSKDARVAPVFREALRDRDVEMRRDAFIGLCGLYRDTNDRKLLSSIDGAISAERDASLKQYMTNYSRSLPR
jgi:hypothetical protein